MSATLQVGQQLFAAKQRLIKEIEIKKDDNYKK
jgi:hypothetical protein